MAKTKLILSSFSLLAAGQSLSLRSLHQRGAATIGLILIALMSGCASSPRSDSAYHAKADNRLEKGMARIELEESHRLPSFFKERWFGELVRLMDQSGTVVFSNYSGGNSSGPVTRLDFNPGTYKALIQCETQTPFRGSSSSMTASIEVTVRADETIKLGCEHYEEPRRDDELGQSKKQARPSVRIKKF